MKQSILFILFFTIISNTLRAQSLNQPEDSLKKYFNEIKKYSETQTIINKSGTLEATCEIPAADYLNEKEIKIKDGLRRVMVSKWTKIN